jgi:hypothetical protein
MTNMLSGKSLGAVAEEVELEDDGDDEDHLDDVSAFGDDNKSDGIHLLYFFIQ